MKVISAIILALLYFSSTANANDEMKVTGIYSSLYYNEEGGDLLGEEIFIVYGDMGEYFASVQCAQGGTRAPFVTKVEVVNNNIEFVVPNNKGHLCTPGMFRGTITNKGISGEFKGSGYKVFLKRGNSYWQ